jgi:ubiquinone/menaquinone biosynthesis C-methylase UbiE
MRLTDLIFFRNHHLCPRWMCFSFDNGLRRLVQNPDAIMKRYIREGDVVLDVGPGIGFFTIPMARIVGDRGRVIAADIQEAMLIGIQKRAIRAGMQDRIALHLSTADAIGVSGKVNFILAFWMAHEVPNQQNFFTELSSVLKDDGKFLMVEPKLHVSRKQFDVEIETAYQAGFALLENPVIPLSHSAILVKR